MIPKKTRNKKNEIEAGILMRQLRKSRSLTLRDVEKASIHLAKVRGTKRGIIPPSQLSLIESQGKIPSIYSLAALSRIYRVDLKKLLSLYRA